MKRHWKWTRRGFLGGAGAAIALPFLESLHGPRRAFAQLDGSTPPKRMLFVYAPNGMHMPSWTPSGSGGDWSLSPILSPLAGVKEHLTVITGLKNEPAIPDGPGDHASGTGAFLTAAHPRKTEGADIQAGISVDQVAAASESETRFPSVQLGIEGGSSVGGCDSGYSCAYARNISWAGPQTPLSKMVNVQLVFDRLFGGVDSAATAAEQAARERRRGSVLDYVQSDAQSLQTRLGVRDRQKLDEYLTGVRELERQIELTGASRTCVAPVVPDEDSFDVTTHVQLMCDLMITAFQCDLTRIFSFMLGNAGSYRSYDFLGISEGHHDISHHQDLQSNFDKLEIIDTWEMEQVAYLIGGLASIEEPDGSTLLDNTLLFFSSEISDGNSHSHYDLPVLLAGSAGGQVTTGRHMSFSEPQPIANLFVSMLQLHGLDIDSFGQDGNGPLSGLV